MFHDSMLSRAALVAVLLLVCGCAGTMQGYSGDPRPREQVARIEPWWQLRFGGSLQTFIVAVDSESLGDHGSADVLPGQHTVKAAVRWMEGSGGVYFEDPNDLVLLAQAGRTYQVKAFAPEQMTEGQHLIGFWIEDKASREVMAGTRPDK